jgi:predicted ribosomally synthesized peptide with SipW-like signal peptide
MNKKLLISLSVLGIVAVVAIGATVAYFSDKETSTNNSFTAGTIDLKVGDANANYNGQTLNGFAITDITSEKFFDFNDVKPGDYGKDTIKIKVGSNPAWACAEILNVRSTEEGLTNPETKINDTDTKGELDEEIYITFYKDNNCDGIKNGTDTTIVDWKLFSQVGKFALADSLHGIALQPGDETCISKMWCFGKVNTETNACDGSTIGNKSQSDKLMADFAIEAIQARHNDKFICNDSCANIDCSQGGIVAGSTCYQGQCVGFGAPSWRRMPTGACEYTGTLVGTGPYTDNTCTTLVSVVPN